MPNLLKRLYFSYEEKFFVESIATMREMAFQSPKNFKIFPNSGSLFPFVGNVCPGVEEPLTQTLTFDTMLLSNSSSGKTIGVGKFSVSCKFKFLRTRTIKIVEIYSTELLSKFRRVNWRNSKVVFLFY